VCCYFFAASTTAGSGFATALAGAGALSAAGFAAGSFLSFVVNALRGVLAAFA